MLQDDEGDRTQSDCRRNRADKDAGSVELIQNRCAIERAARCLQNGNEGECPKRDDDDVCRLEQDRAGLGSDRETNLAGNYVGIL